MRRRRENTDLLEAAATLNGAALKAYKNTVDPLILDLLLAWPIESNGIREALTTEALQAAGTHDGIPFPSQITPPTGPVRATFRRGWLAMDWLVRAYAPVWLEAVGQTAEAAMLRDLPAMETVSWQGPSSASVEHVTRAVRYTTSQREHEAYQSLLFRERDIGPHDLRIQGPCWSTGRALGERAAKATGLSPEGAWEILRGTGIYADSSWMSVAHDAEDMACDAARLILWRTIKDAIGKGRRVELGAALRPTITVLTRSKLDLLHRLIASRSV